LQIWSFRGKKTIKGQLLELDVYHRFLEFSVRNRSKKNEGNLYKNLKCDLYVYSFLITGLLAFEASSQFLNWTASVQVDDFY